METRVLVTGFEPFGGDTINPALEAVNKLEGRTLHTDSGTIKLFTHKIPVVFGEAALVLDESIADAKPEIVICVGQAGGRYHITPERVAINVDDSPIPDNAGNAPIDAPIIDGGPAAYFTTLPIKRMVKAIQEAGIPASVSNTAGTYVCNHLFYHLMHLLHTKYQNIRGGFIHIPYLPEQAVNRLTPTMSLDAIVNALTIAIITASKEETDELIAGGQQC